MSFPCRVECLTSPLNILSPNNLLSKMKVFISKEIESKVVASYREWKKSNEDRKDGSVGRDAEHVQEAQYHEGFQKRSMKSGKVSRSLCFQRIRAMTHHSP